MSMEQAHSDIGRRIDKATRYEEAKDKLAYVRECEQRMLWAQEALVAEMKLFDRATEQAIAAGSICCECGQETPDEVWGEGPAKCQRCESANPQGYGDTGGVK